MKILSNKIDLNDQLWHSSFANYIKAFAKMEVHLSFLSPRRSIFRSKVSTIRCQPRASLGPARPIKTRHSFCWLEADTGRSMLNNPLRFGCRVGLRKTDYLISERYIIVKLPRAGSCRAISKKNRKRFFVVCIAGFANSPAAPNRRWTS